MKIAENPPNYGNCDAKSLVEMLYWAYTEYNPILNQTTKDRFRDLNNLLNTLSIHDTDDVLNVACDLCMEHTWLGFEAGLKMGLILTDELAAWKVN